MSKQPDDLFDPFGQWRAMRDNYMDAMSKAMIEMTSSDEYARSQARMLDAYLSISVPFQKALETAMTQTLTQLNMPTRTDVTNLAERLTNIEMRLDDLDARLESIDAKLQVAKPAQRPPRKAEGT
jgi:BMFP domain-containing protein YqiC